jgi:hypothetical protein
MNMILVWMVSRCNVYVIPESIRRKDLGCKWVRVHRTVISEGCQVHTVISEECQVPQEMGGPLSRRPTSWPQNMGERPWVSTATLGQEDSLHVFRIPNRTPGWGCRNQFQCSRLRTHSAVLSTWTRFLDCHELPVVPETTFQWFQI